MRRNRYQEEGEEAYLQGLHFTANPYGISPKGYAWRVGWSCAWAEDGQRETAAAVGGRKDGGGWSSE